MSPQVFIGFCKTRGLPEPTPEFRFHPERKWRFDYAFVEQKIAVEIEGGIWIRGRHNNPSGMLKDIEKYAEATCLGWRVLRVATDHLHDGRAFDWIERALT